MKKKNDELISDILELKSLPFPLFYKYDVKQGLIEDNNFFKSFNLGSNYTSALIRQEKSNNKAVIDMIELGADIETLFYKNKSFIKYINTYLKQF